MTVLISFADLPVERTTIVKLQMSLRDNVKSLFTTPLAQFILPNATRINPGLSKFLLEMERRSRSDQHPPLEGWHSVENLAEADHPDVIELMDSAHSAVLSMLGIVARSTRFEAQQNLRAWASVYRPRTFSQPDFHSGNSWSGIYFVQSAKSDTEHSRLAGQLSFHDPRNRVGIVNLPGSNYKSTFEVKPRDGLMVVYPAWLQCHLNPFESDSVMLLISFKSRITKFSSVD